MPNLNIDIAYYNDEQRTLFQGFPNANALNQIVQNGISITEDEFLAYMMFMDQDDNYTGYRTYAELRDLISSRLGDLQNYISYNNNSVQSIVPPERMHNARFTERIGISLGLCLINKIYGFTAADWKKIPETTLNSTFDFEIPVASTGTNFIQVENKGCIVDDNSYKRPTVSSRYGEIKVKKDYVRDEEIKKQIPIHQNLYYGTIGVLDNRPNSNAKIWLVDPPAFEIEMDPKKYKLLARLNFYLDEFRNIGVKKRITEALEERIKEIELSKDFMQLNFKKLDDRFPVSGGYYLYMEGRMFASIDTNEAFGRIFLIEDKQRVAAYLIAYPKTIMRLIVRQDFEAIMDYAYSSDFMKEKVQVLMKYSKSDIAEYKMQDNLKFIFNERNRFFEAIYFGKVNYTSDGRIFGLLNQEIENE
jgi:hypothetical protein